MGDTVLQDPFERNRWVYLYTLEVPDFFNQQLKMVLDFEDDLLTTISGDLAPIAQAAETAEQNTGTETDAQASLSEEDGSNTDEPNDDEPSEEEPSEEASGE